MSRADSNPYGYSRLLDEDEDGSDSVDSRTGLSHVFQEPDRERPLRVTRKPIHHVTVHVREGQQYRTFIRLLHKAVSQTHTDDESLPDLPRDEQLHRYLLIRAGEPPGPKDSLDIAATGMIVRRMCLMKSAAAKLVLSPCNQAQSEAMKVLSRRGFHLSKTTVSSMMRSKGASWLRTPRMTPVAAPANILQHLKASIDTFNSKAPLSSHVYAFTTEALRKVSAVVSIQSAWRAYATRCTADVTGRALRRRAAVCIQRAWRSILFQTHLRSLDAAQLLLDSMSAVTVVPNLCLTLLSARMMSFCVQRRSHCLPLHRLRWGFLECTGEVVLICDDAEPRPGVPMWLECPILVIPASLARAHGKPVTADVPIHERTANRQHVLANKRWIRVRDMLSADGWIDLKGLPQHAPDCVSLLESDTRVREMQAAGAEHDAAVAALPEHTVMRMIMFSSPEEAARRALLLFLLTWDPLYEQAAELIPVGLSSAMASSMPHAAAARGNAEKDAWSMPAIGAVSRLVDPAHMDHERVRRHLTVAIALSLPGASKLLPFLYSIAGTITSGGAEPAPTSTPHGSNHSLVAKPRGLVSFVHDYPAWLVSRRQKAGASVTDVAMVDQAEDLPRECDSAGGCERGIVEELSGMQIGSGDTSGGAAEEVLYETVQGYVVRGPASDVEDGLRRAVAGLDGGVRGLRNAPVHRALAGAFGRMEQHQHEAFLRMRAADLLARKRVIVEAVRSMPSVMPRSTNTSNSTVPSMPQSIAAAARSVQQLRRVWQKRNMLLVAAVREAHALAAHSMQCELSTHVARAKTQRNVDRTTATVCIRDGLMVGQDAALGRVAASRALEDRRAALKAVRGRSRAIGCAMAAEGRADTRARRYRAEVQRHKQTAFNAADRFERKLEREEAADAERVSQSTQRQAAAQAVREAGFTEAHAAAQAGAAREAQEHVRTARLEDRERCTRVGLAGGVWGGTPREVLRRPCPVTSVVAAAQNYVPEEEWAEDGASVSHFTDVEPWALPRVYADFLPCLVGVHPLHGAKVAFGKYVGIPSIPFGHMVGRVRAEQSPAATDSVDTNRA
eukprot:jgi/Ulvmu1/12734/UM095_0039.1